MSNTGFLLTDAGLADASAASPSGPYFHVASFRIGSKFNYTPTRGQSSLLGDVLYSGVPTSYSVVDNDTVETILTMDTSVGDFFFGEIGIYSASNILLGVCVFDALQQKVRAIGNQAGSLWRLHCRIKLAQAPAIVQVNITNTNTLLEVPSWPSLLPPSDQLSGANAVIVHEANSSGESILAIRHSSTQWNLVNYGILLDVNLGVDIGASATVSSITSPEISNIFFDLPKGNSKYVIKFPDGKIRRINIQPASDTISWVPALTSAPTGYITIWQDGLSPYPGVPIATAYEYNQLALQFNRFWSVPTGNYSATNAGINQVAFPQLARRPSLVDWTLLSSSIRAYMGLFNFSASTVASVIDFDWVLRQNAFIDPGMDTRLIQFKAMKDAILSLDGSRNVTKNLSFVESATLPTLNRVRTPPFSNPVYYEFETKFSSESVRGGIANGGSMMTITPGVTINTSPFWEGWRLIFLDIGSIRIGEDTANSSNGFGTSTPFNLRNLTSTPTVVYSATRIYTAYSPNPMSMNLTASVDKVLGKYKFRITLTPPSVGTYTSYAASGSMNLQVAWRRAAASKIFNPVHEYPVPAVLTSTF